jgi:hypothetical protein
LDIFEIAAAVNDLSDPLSSQKGYKNDKRLILDVRFDG